MCRVKQDAVVTEDVCLVSPCGMSLSSTVPWTSIKTNDSGTSRSRQGARARRDVPL